MSLSRGRKHVESPKVEINIVPLVDVALVLLIIFMVTMTFARSAGMQLQLPTSETAKQIAATPRELVIGVDARGQFVWAGSVVSDAQLAEQLRREARQGTDCRVKVEGDTRAAHGRVVRAMTLAQLAGFARLVIATRERR